MKLRSASSSAGMLDVYFRHIAKRVKKNTEQKKNIEYKQYLSGRYSRGGNNLSWIIRIQSSNYTNAIKVCFWKAANWLFW